MIRAYLATTIQTLDPANNKGNISYDAWVQWSDTNKGYDYFVEEDDSSFEKLYKKKNTISIPTSTTTTTTYILLVEVKLTKEMEILVNDSRKTIVPSEVTWSYKQ